MWKLESDFLARFKQHQQEDLYFQSYLHAWLRGKSKYKEIVSNKSTNYVFKGNL